jgi:hypothetical protein
MEILAMTSKERLLALLEISLGFGIFYLPTCHLELNVRDLSVNTGLLKQPSRCPLSLQRRSLA